MKTSIFIFLLTLLFLNISLVSSFEFDNVKNYNPTTKEVTITNAFGLGDVIGKARLNTPLNVIVGQGYQKVAEFEIEAYEDYNKAIKQFTFNDMNNKKQKINRDYDLKYKTYEEVEVNDYGESIISYNEDGIVYESVIIGTHLESREVWKKITPADLKKNDILTVGVFTDVKKGDYVDWIPTIYGVEIEEWATWTESLNTDIEIYYKLDETSGAVIDSTKQNNGTNSGATPNVAGKINTAYDFEITAETDNITSDTNTGITGADSWTLNGWMKAESSGTGEHGVVFTLGVSGGTNNVFSIGTDDNIVNEIFIGCWGGCDVNAPSGVTLIGEWHMLTATYDGTDIRVYIDGTNIKNTTDTLTLTNAVLNIGTLSVSGQHYFDGVIDEVSLWSRTLTTDEIEQLYNEGTGISYTDTFESISVTLNDPANDTLQSNTLVEFNWTITPNDVNISNWTLEVFYTNNTIAHQHINNTLNTGDPLTVIHNDTLFFDESYYWNVESCGTKGAIHVCDISENRTFTIDTIPPVVNITYPPENFIVGNPNQSITVNYTVFHDGTPDTCFLNNSVNSTIVIINCSANTTTITYPPTSPNNLTIFVYSNDTAGNLGSDNVTIFKDTTKPTILIESPTGTLKTGKIGNNETLNVTVIDSGLDTCWYDYNGTNITIEGCLTGVKNSTNFILQNNNFNLTVYANDTFGNINSSFVEWEYKVLELDQTYNSETTEGSLETFLANIKLSSGNSISEVVLVHNGTIISGQSFATGTNTTLRKTNLLIPNVDTDTNVTFYWDITLSDSTNLQLNSKNQTIYNLDIDNCSSYTTELFNFTIVDEELQIILPNATIEIAVNIYDNTRTELTLNYSKLFNKVNPLRICLNRNVSSDSFYSVDTIVKYKDIAHANEYYNIVNRTITNGTASQRITLYDLNLSDSTEFQLTFIGADFLPIENALIYVDRQYISENRFKTVELPKTDYNGQSVLHLVRNNVIYNIRITKDGVVLGNFENLVAFCDDFTIGDCNIELNAFDSVENIFDYDSGTGLIFTEPTYNSTENEISFNFLTSDGSAKTVRLEVTRNDIFGNRSICNDSIISSGGTLTCSIDPNLDESTLRVSVYTDEVLTVKGSIDLDTTNYGVVGYLVMFIMAMSFILMFSGSKTGVLVSLGLTLAGSIGMGLVSGNITGVGASGIWLLVIIFIGIYKLNKDRQS